MLDVLCKNFELVLVVTRPDKPVGRKKILTPSPTKVWAQKNNIPVETNLTNLLSYSPTDLGIIADFGQIIPEEIFSLPKLGTFNIHFSKLPDLRGPSPVQATLLRGDTTAWITIFQLEKTLDTGPILWQKSYPIGPTETAGELYTRLFREVASKIPSLIPRIPQLPLIPQAGAPTFCKMLTRQDGFVKWPIIRRCCQGCTLARELYNKFRAYYPWPGLWSIDSSGKRLKILKCHPANNKLVLDEVQFEGEKPKPPPSF